ncbi:hypothetical protein SCORR_v1c07390 [Spiroplasma corruscae]|uniref:Transmembrane protein n=1 Tax=Spiroplasma corruscae TaxID=216934 RepID=A0A222EQ69_9MOLU|nr:YIP1 family protein [Spiroplasma corruscae]ASP28511.1 hypothetical protein SCORR_v1c07390 [Spiroplasma corruscae]
MGKVFDFFKPNNQNNQQNIPVAGNFVAPNQNMQAPNYNQLPSNQYNTNQPLPIYNQQQYNQYQQPQYNNQYQPPQQVDIQSYQQNLINSIKPRYNNIQEFNNLEPQSNYSNGGYQPNNYFNQGYGQGAGNYNHQEHQFNNYGVQYNNQNHDIFNYENNLYNRNNEPLNQNHYNQNYVNQNYVNQNEIRNDKYFKSFNNYPNQQSYNDQAIREMYLDPNSYYNNRMHSGYEEFSNGNQFYNNGNNYSYNQNYNYANASANNYNSYKKDNSYKKRLKEASIIPKEIGREIRSEKLRVFILFMVGSIGIIITSLMLAIYYKTDENISKFIGVQKEKVMYPFFSILLLIISVGFFGVSLTDFTLLFSNVRKYERDLIMGNESIPYFITRNYKALISRAIYINWICFSTYIFGSIILGILYSLQSQAGKTAYILFWDIGTLKTLQSEITVNIIILLVALLVHVFNIITTRNRKNNIISYYGYEIIPEQEIKNIKKRANKICIIIFCVVMLLLLFLILIPWLIIRRKRGQSLKPWKFNQ